MNFKKYLLTTAAAATALVGMVSAPAQAIQFGSSGIKFDTDTTVDFTFLESHGYFRTTFGILGSDGTKTSLLAEKDRSDNSSSANDWQGTCGKAVVTCSNSFTFSAGQTYSFYLEGVRDNGTTYAINANSKFFNPTDTATVLADTSYKNINTSPNSLLAKTPSSSVINPFDSVLLAFEDNGLDNAGKKHIDFNDVMVTAKARKSSVSVPEPTTLVGLGLVAGTLAFARRRNSKVDQLS